MPLLPHLYRRAATAADTRIVESRQWGAIVRHASRSLSRDANTLFDKSLTIIKRTPTLVRRDASTPECSNGIIGACYQGLDSGPSPGVVVGIVLGSIGGFVLLLWVLWILSSGATFIQTDTLQVEDVSVSRRRSRSPRSRRSHRSSYNAEMRRSSPRRDRVVRQERIVRDIPPPRRERERETETSRIRESVIVEESSRPERRVEGDDIVEVIEEHSSVTQDAPPPRRQSRRGSSYR